MTLDLINAPSHIESYFAITNNLADGPLMLGFLTYLSYSKNQKKLMKLLIAGLVVFAAIVVFITGYNDNAVRIVLGPGILLVLLFTGKFLGHYTKYVIRKPNSAGKMLISASLIFCYGTYAIIYILFYVFRIKDIEDTLLIYFLATIFSSGGMAIGVYYEAKKIRRIKEVQQARRELADLYADEINSPNRRKARVPDDLFGFDPSQVIPGFRN